MVILNNVKGMELSTKLREQLNINKDEIIHIMVTKDTDALVFEERQTEEIIDDFEDIEKRVINVKAKI